LACSSVPLRGFFRNSYESRKVAPKERGAYGLHQGQPFARFAISFQLLNYFHAIKVANAGKRFKGLLV
jgi:hypothetical protein